MVSVYKLYLNITDIFKLDVKTDYLFLKKKKKKRKAELQRKERQTE